MTTAADGTNFMRPLRRTTLLTAFGFVLAPTRLFIRLDVTAIKQTLAAVHPREGVPQIDLSIANGFHLRTFEFDPGLDDFEDVILVAGLAVAGDLWIHGVKRRLRPDGIDLKPLRSRRMASPGVGREN